VLRSAKALQDARRVRELVDHGPVQAAYVHRFAAALVPERGGGAAAEVPPGVLLLDHRHVVDREAEPLGDGGDLGDIPPVELADQPWTASQVAALRSHSGACWRAKANPCSTSLRTT